MDAWGMEAGVPAVAELPDAGMADAEAVGLNTANISRSCFTPLASNHVTFKPEMRNTRPPPGKRPPGGSRTSPAPSNMKIASGPRAPLAMPTAMGGMGGGGGNGSAGLGAAPQGASSFHR